MIKIQYFSGVLLFLGLISSSAFATNSQIRCSGSDMYGDVVWTNDIAFSGNVAAIRYIEKTGGGQPQTQILRVSVQNGRLELPSPDGAVRIFLILSRSTPIVQYFDRSTMKLLTLNPFSQFSCI